MNSSLYGEMTAEDAEDAIQVLARALAREQLESWSAKGISDYDDDAFVEHLAGKLTPLMVRETALVLPSEQRPVINLFGYGQVQEVLVKFDPDSGKPTSGGYFWGHEAAEALGWDAATFAEWCHKQRGFDLSEQRARDEESGVLGWEWLLYHPMEVSVWQGEGASEDHYINGEMRGPIMRYWADIYLIDTDQVMAMMSSSPWGSEFMDSVIPLMSHAMNASGLEEKAKGIPTYRRRENSLGEVETEVAGSLADMFARDREGITEEEARQRAFRGPVLPEGDAGGRR